jgi:phage tail-like protein
MSVSVIQNLDAGMPQSAQRLPAYLPAIYRADAFLGQYLWAFEQVLLGLEQEIGSIASLFDPFDTPPEFVPWLSSWVAFTLRADLSPVQQRSFIARVVSLYRRRGTRENLQDLLSIFTRGAPIIVESDDAGPAHHFHITLRFGPASPDDQRRQIAIAHALIDLEKPAHTSYDLELLVPTMQIGVTSHVGVDTLLGNPETVHDGGVAPAAASDRNLAPKASASSLTQKARKSGPKRKRRTAKAKQAHRTPKAKRARPASRAKPERPSSETRRKRPKTRPKRRR